MSKLNREQVIYALRNLGIRIKGNKVSRKDFKKIFAAQYSEPEWFRLSDYKLDTPQNYMQIVQMDEDKLGRNLLPSTFQIARFGNFLNEKGDDVVVDGLIYQYSLQGNPRNVRFASRVFVGGENISKNSGMVSDHESENDCVNVAKKIIETQLFDLA